MDLNTDLPPQHPGKHFNFVTDLIDQWAQDADLRAMIWTDGNKRRDLTFQHFSKRAKRVATWLHELGLRKGDRLVIMLPRLVEWFEIALGAILSGIVLIPVTTLLTAKDLAHRFRVSSARLFVSDPSGLEKLAKVDQGDRKALSCVVQVGDASNNEASAILYDTAKIDQLAPTTVSKTESTDPCLIYFTSGTTGNPKMVLHNQISAPLAHLVTGRQWLQLKTDSVYWNTAEFGWAKHAYSLFGCWSNGATLFVLDDRKAFDPLRLIDTLHRFEITHMCAPPTAYRQLVTNTSIKAIDSNKPKSLRVCTAAGEALNGEVYQKWKRATGVSIFEGYGQSETPLLIGNFLGRDVVPGSMGHPAAGMPMVVADDQGNELGSEQDGNIAFVISVSPSHPDCPWLFDGYLAADGSTKRPEVTNKKGQRLYLTGDKARRDKDGAFHFTARADDLITSRGYRIGPFEVESVLQEHPSVVESAVVASPDEHSGDIVKAFVVLQAEYESADQAKLAKELEAFVASRTAPYKKPRAVEFVKALPKTVSGKIRRVELRALEVERKKGSSKL